ncbi:hypothetical protein TWF481_006242 [Arthrobotrys musiformis]|uniref:Phytocyanin domain-containing protein n=1 Tax=Arthrobotrys musiformis TaxID=47236 RepID=A0AAV9WG62_9PEZI
MHIQNFFTSIILSAVAALPLSAARDPSDPGLCFSNPTPRWNAAVPYNISTTFRRGLCQVSVTFSDDRFPVLFFTTTQALDNCGAGEVNQIRLPTAVPNGIATIEQTCAWSSGSLCVSVSIEGGAGDPTLFTETGHFTVERLCANDFAVTTTDVDAPLLEPTSFGTNTISVVAASTTPSTDPLTPSRAGATVGRGTPGGTPTNIGEPSNEATSSPTWISTAIMTLMTSTTKSTGTPTPPTSVFIPQTHTVNLDYSGNAFVPNQVSATVGDVIQFMFLSPGHSIIETSLQFPCIPEIEGFVSGSETSPGRNFNNSISLTVTKLNPRYFACGEVDHCQKGMVFAVNAGDLRFSQFVGNIKSSATRSTTNSQTVTFSPLSSVDISNEALPTACSVCPTTASIPSTSTVL